MANPNLSELITTTLRNRATEIADNVTEKNALLSRLKQKGKIRTLDGGREITKPIYYDETGTFQYYNGYDVLNISPSDVISSATYNWKNAAVNVSISGEEERQNSGSEQIIDFLEARIENAMNTMSNNINVGMYSDGTGSGGKQIGGLQLLVADDPTTGSPGGIDRSTFTFWRNESYDTTTDGGGAASATNIQGYMNTVWNTIVRGTDAPDLLTADSNYYGFYENALQTNQRFGDVRTVDGGFESLKYKTADVILDGTNAIPTNHMYFLNTDYLGMDVHRDAFFTPKPGKDSINQDATVVPLLFMGNMTMSNGARQGVLKD
jgi:hypothetical protein